MNIVGRVEVLNGNLILLTAQKCLMLELVRACKRPYQVSKEAGVVLVNAKSANYPCCVIYCQLFLFSVLYNSLV